VLLATVWLFLVAALWMIIRPLPAARAIASLSRRAAKALGSPSGSDDSKQRASFLFSRQIMLQTLRLTAFLALTLLSGAVTTFALHPSYSLDDVTNTMFSPEVLIWLTVLGLGWIGVSYAARKIRRG